MDGLDGLVGESATTQANQVHASIAHRLLAGNDVWRNVLTGTGAALEHDVAAHMQELVEQARCRDDGAVINDDLSGKFRGVADDAAVADDTVMTDMHVLHQQIAIANHGLALRCCAAADGDVLANGVVVTYLAGRHLALELQVLGFRRDAGSREELVIVSDACPEMDGDIVQELVVVANDHVFVNHAERAYHVVVAKFGLRVNDS